jgi:hypothetical protein
MRVSVRAWPGPPGPATPAGDRLPYWRDSGPPGKCDDFSAGYGLRPSSLRSGVSTPCMTVFTGVTSCGRRGNGSGQTVGQPGWIASPWRMWWRSTELSGCWPGSRLTSAKAVTVLRLPGAWTSRNHKAGSGRSAYRRSVTGWPSRRPGWCWSPFSRRISCRARMGSGRNGPLRRRWNGSGPASSRAASSSRSSTSATSSARSAMTGCSLRWGSGCRTGGC